MMIRVAGLVGVIYAVLWPSYARPTPYARDIVLEEIAVTSPTGSRGMLFGPRVKDRIRQPWEQVYSRVLAFFAEHLR
jgi:hypothetical protein